MQQQLNLLCRPALQQLAKFVDDLEQQKQDDEWLEGVKEEAAKVVVFHKEQYRQWELISNDIEAYVASVKALAEVMAVNGGC